MVVKSPVVEWLLATPAQRAATKPTEVVRVPLDPLDALQWLHKLLRAISAIPPPDHSAARRPPEACPLSLMPPDQVAEFIRSTLAQFHAFFPEWGENSRFVQFGLVQSL